MTRCETRCSKLPRILLNCRASTLPREPLSGQLQMCDALPGSDDLVQCAQGIMPCSVGNLEDLDEDILSTFLNKKRLSAATKNHKHLHNAAPKVELEVCSRD